jgi:elongation factor Ts
MAIKASMVKELREMTGASMMDCKNALVETDGDVDQAVEYLKEKGLAKAAKKAGRIAAEGLVRIAISEDEKTAAVVEVNSETDFVAKNEEFITFVDDLAKLALTAESNDMDAFKAMAYDGATVGDALTAKIAKIGENMSLRRIDKATGDVLTSYIHGGGRIGVLIDAKCDVVNDAVIEALKNVAMQVAALKPQYVCRDEISAEFIAKEEEILMAAARNEKPDAPDKILMGMVKGRLNKELKEFCLVDQVYVKAEDGKQSVAQYLDQVSKAVGAKLTVKKFVRFETGEGLEKKQENFAEEVAKQMGQ